MIEQSLREPMFRAFLVLILCSVVGLSVLPTLPQATVLYLTCSLLILAYFIVATAGNIIEKTDRFSIELFLAKPFSRRDIILADFLGTITVVSALSLLLSLGLWFVFGVRQNEWGPTFIALFFSLSLGFISLYCFIILTGLVIRNVSVVIITWVGYVYFGALLLETRADFIYAKMPGLYVRIVLDTVYYSLPHTLSIAKVFSRFTFNTINDFLPIIFSLASGTAALMSAVFIFNRRDLD